MSGARGAARAGRKGHCCGDARHRFVPGAVDLGLELLDAHQPPGAQQRDEDKHHEQDRGEVCGQWGEQAVRSGGQKGRQGCVRGGVEGADRLARVGGHKEQGGGEEGVEQLRGRWIGGGGAVRALTQKLADLLTYC